ncbi:MAG TPA: type VII secretion-associated serine protease mycosin [Pseudonocardiaceae bacterium]|nr:type VII secretion-associated serine protease mycosin [Pseudonocardiaceae bacterium]
MRALAALRHHLVTLAATVLCLAGPASPAAAEPSGRPPGVPPAVDMSALPNPASVNAMPYVVNNPATRQLGPVEQQAPCQQPAPDSGQNLAAEPPAQRRLQIRQAQRFATGRGQRVAVIDSGVQPHTRLRGRTVDGGDYIENRTGLFDCDGHGTAVAGLIAAAPDPSSQFVGVAPAAQILAIRQASTFYSVPLRQLDTGAQTRNPMAGDTVSMARAVMHAVQLGATVINVSEAACFPAEPDQVNAPDLEAAVHYAVEHNVVVVVAAANTSASCKQNNPGRVTTISSPGWFDDDVLTVAATDDDGRPADFSIHGPWVDVAAPGTDAVSVAAGRPGLTSGLVDAHGQLRPLDGTSFAAPYVAGLAALVRERFPHLSARQVMHRIERTAQQPTGPCRRSEDVGYGMIDPVAALTAVLPEEGQPGPAPVNAANAKLSGFPSPPPDNTPRMVALTGSVAALVLLGLTLMVVQILKRRQRG